MVQEEWREILEAAVKEGRGDHWLSWLHLGVMRYHAGDDEAARAAWETSIEHQPSSWALRNMAVQASHRGDSPEAAELWLQAYRLAPGLTPLAVECTKALLDAGRAEEVDTLLQTAPAEVLAHGRLRVYQAQAAYELGDFDKAEAILKGSIELADLREGEVLLSDLWYAIQEQRVAAAEGLGVDEELKKRVRKEYPLPEHLDFRMSAQSNTK